MDEVEKMNAVKEAARLGRSLGRLRRAGKLAPLELLKKKRVASRKMLETITTVLAAASATNGCEGEFEVTPDGDRVVIRKDRACVALGFNEQGLLRLDGFIDGQSRTSYVRGLCLDPDTEEWDGALEAGARVVVGAISAFLLDKAERVRSWSHRDPELPHSILDPAEPVDSLRARIGVPVTPKPAPFTKSKKLPSGRS